MCTEASISPLVGDSRQGVHFSSRFFLVRAFSFSFSRDRTPAGGGVGRARVVSTSVASPRTPRPKKNNNADSADKPTTGSTFTSVLLMYHRNSAITPALPLIRKSTTLRSTLWCSHYSVAKRQQFSCPLGTATLSLKLKNVVLGR